MQFLQPRRNFSHGPKTMMDSFLKVWFPVKKLVWRFRLWFWQTCRKKCCQKSETFLLEVGQQLLYQAIIESIFSIQNFFLDTRNFFCQPYRKIFARNQCFFYINFRKKCFYCFFKTQNSSKIFCGNLECSVFNCRIFWLETRSLSHWRSVSKIEKHDFFKIIAFFFSNWAAGKRGNHSDNPVKVPC